MNDHTVVRWVERPKSKKEIKEGELAAEVLWSVLPFAVLDELQRNAELRAESAELVANWGQQIQIKIRYSGESISPEKL